MKLYGLNKTTLLDYPEHVACTVFTGGCNFRCPFCHNADLVLPSQGPAPLTEEDFFAYLHKRKNMLEGVCITGGEPTLQSDLKDFIRKIRSVGYLVKLDTNGYRPEILASLLEEGLLDYVAMDIKSSRQGYAAAAGISDLTLSKIEESVTLLKEGNIPYEFRTTVVKELHTKEDFEDIASWLAGCRAYYLQSYTDGNAILGHRLTPGCTFHACDPQEMRNFADLLKEASIPAFLRGMN